MNPDGTNSSTNTGATGSAGNGAGTGSVVPPALDFTSSDTTSLSMADSLASAADNLTSAGMAAKEPDNGSIGLGQIGASDPSATMERPTEPLVPAAPVPGSLGSVTSGPAVATSDDTTPASAAPSASAVGSAGFGGNATTGFGTAPAGFSATSGFGAGAGVSTAAGLGATNNAGSAGRAGMAGGLSGAGMTNGGIANTGAMNAGMANTETTSAGMTGVGTSGAGAANIGTPNIGASSEPYNPFAARMGAKSPAGSAGAQTSSTNVPMGSQPVTEKFSTKLSGAHKSGLLTVVLGILAAVSLVMAVVFAILWQQAEANKKVVYEPPKDDTNVNHTMAMITCTKDLGADLAETLAGLTGHSATVTANFSDDNLTTIALLNKYFFVDNAAAEAARPFFADQVTWYNDVANNLGIAAATTSTEVVDAALNFDVSVAPEQLMGDYIGVFGLAAGEDGKVNGSRESVQSHYEANGFVCAEA